MLRSTLFISSLFIIIAAATRLLPHPPNFTPLLAISLFGGAYLQNRFLAAFVPVGAMFLSDLFLGFHDLMIPIYFLMVGMSLVGRSLKENHSVLRVGAFSLGGSVLFFIVTNFLVWVSSGMYSLNIAGLVQSYTMAIPFFQNQVAGDLVYNTFLFGSMYYLTLNRWVVAPSRV